MSLYAALKRPGPSGFGYGSTAEAVTEGLDLRGQTFLLTGSNSGIGLETLRVLRLRGAHLIAAARTEASAEAALASCSGEGTPVACDLSEPASVRSCLESVRRLGRSLDGIIANAGVMALPAPVRKAGLELQFLTNHIGHFILVTGLLELLTPRGRVVMVSSSAHRRAPAEGIRFDDLAAERHYSAWTHYGQSKLANLLFARELARRLAGGEQTSNALHPGVIRTNLARHLNPAVRALFFLGDSLAFKSIPQGAATQCYVATRPELGGVSGRYFADCNEVRPSRLAEDDQLAARLWQVSEEIVARL